MTYFKLDRFGGMAPAISPRLLAEQFGQLVKNAKLDTGNLRGRPPHPPTSAGSVASSARRSIYLYYKQDGTSVWLQWDQTDISVAKGPIPGDTTNRLYWTGQNYPRIGWQSTIISGAATGYPANSYRLGVPAPHTFATVTVNGLPDDTLTPNDVSYVFTYVTVDGREGPPSAPSGIVSMDDSQTATLSIPALNVGSNHNLGNGAVIRIYRSNSGSTSAAFQFVNERPISTTSYTDTKNADELGEVIPSAGWIGPPDDDSSLYPDGPLKGLIPLAQGVMAGFTGKRFCLSEAFLPHAWPIAYRITTEDDIVAIASTSGGVTALTDGQPYFISGTDPSAMTATRIDLAQACLNEHSVVDMGQYVIYAGADGLCAVEGGQGKLLTDGLIKPAQWRDATGDYRPKDYKAFRHEGMYVAFHSQGGFVYDPRSDETALILIDNSNNSNGGAVVGGYTDPKDNQLYTLCDTRIQEFEAVGDGEVAAQTLDATFKSKIFKTDKPISMGWMSIDANQYGFPATVKVWADGTLIFHAVVSKTADSDFSLNFTVPAISTASVKGNKQPVFRLPAVVGQEWEIEVQSADLNSVCIAQTLEEIQSS